MSIYLSQLGDYSCHTNWYFDAYSDFPSYEIPPYADFFEVTADMLSDDTISFDWLHPRDHYGMQILFHHTLCRSADCPQDIVDSTLGKWEIRTVQYQNGNSIVLDQAPNLDLEHFHVQGVWFISYDGSDVVKGGDIPNGEIGFNYKSIIGTYDYNSDTPYCGGIIALKADELVFNGWTIQIPAGIPTSLSNLRPLTTQEQNGTLDSQSRAGEENSIPNPFPMNVGDHSGGLVFIIANKIYFETPSYYDEDTGEEIEVPTTLNMFDPSGAIGSRYNYLSHEGVANCRGATDDSNTPSGYSNVGGPGIFIACKRFHGFEPRLIRKYVTTTSNTGAKGLSRAYIAIADQDNSDIPQDGRLYFLDNLIESDPEPEPEPITHKLRYRKGGSTFDIPLSNSKTGKAVAVKTVDGIFYANLVDPAAENASDIRVRAGGQTYALANS